MSVPRQGGEHPVARLSRIPATIGFPPPGHPVSPARIETISPRRLVILLGVTQIIGYGTVYYGFAILADDIATDFGWPTFGVFGVFSLALLLGGLVAPFAGRRLDRHGAAPLMAFGSIIVALALALAGLTRAPLPFAVALVAIELAANLVLYDAAFTALAQTTGREARRRITHLTLIAGFASTLFWPLTSWLNALMDWGWVMVTFACLNLVVCLPLHLLMMRSAPVRPSGQLQAAAVTELTVEEPVLPEAARRRALILATGGFAASNTLLSAITTQMVPMLAALGLGGVALVVAALFGPAQVIVRFLNMAAGHHRHPIGATIMAATLLPAAALLLALTAPYVLGAVLFAVFLGCGSGLKSVVQGTLPLVLFGRRDFGATLGTMAFARQIAGSVAPFLFAWLIEVFGARVALIAFAGIAGLGVAAFVAVARIRRDAAPAA